MSLFKAIIPRVAATKVFFLVKLSSEKINFFNPDTFSWSLLLFTGTFFKGKL